MKFIFKLLCASIGVTVFGFFIGILELIKFISSKNNISIVLFLSIAIMTLFASLSVIEYKHLQAARLIIENQILHICPVKIETKKQEIKSANCTRNIMELYISCFGILMNSRVIKFNQEKVYLMAVEIGYDSISLTYGSNKNIQVIKLLHGTIDSGKLTNIMEKFRYETGITPTITN